MDPTPSSKKTPCEPGSRPRSMEVVTPLLTETKPAVETSHQSDGRPATPLGHGTVEFKAGGGISSDPIQLSPPNWRRFTNNFVCPAPAWGQAGGAGGEGREERGMIPMQVKAEDKGQSVTTKSAQQRRKTRAGRIVPSRYMAAAVAVAGRKPPLSMAASSGDSKTAGPTSRTKPGHSGSDPKSFRVPSQATRAKLASRPPMLPAHFTPSNVRTSTPLAPRSAQRASNSSYLRTGATPTLAKPSSTHKLPSGKKANPGGSKVKRSALDTASKISSCVHRECGGKKKEEEEEEEEELWWHLALQACYLELQLSKACAAQEREAMSQLHQMWAAVKVVNKKNAALLTELEERERALTVETHTKALLAGLGPVYDQLDRLERDYVAMTAALDSTRHEMAMSGFAPFKNLEVELAVCDELLGEIEQSHKPAQVSGLAATAQVTASSLEQEVQELESCHGDLMGVTGRQLLATSLLLEARQQRRQGRSHGARAN